MAIIAHQGDTLDYQNLIPLKEHAEKLTILSGREVKYIDDVCGPAACEAVNALREGECILLGNLRYLCEEISGFEKEVKLQPCEMLDTWLVRTLAPLFDLYVNDAFSAAHRNCPSMTAFQQVLPTAAGFLLFDEYKALYKRFAWGPKARGFRARRREDFRRLWHDGGCVRQRHGG